ncbi:MAG: VCBS repeat-containing protein, partial [Myxococcales bacterium]|nr:VCBS repeat-containing protein [Myxococcales bacterium]
VRLTESEPGVGESAALGVGSVVGDARPELLVAVGSQIHVIGLLEGRPMRVATLGSPSAATPARPIAADVTGDGHADLVLGHARPGPEGGPIGGTLQLVPSNALGALEDARVLAPIAVTGLVAVDDDRGARLGAANWTDGFGRRASELWTFAGGASPVRRGRARIGNDASDVVAADLDGDGEVELVALDAQGLTRVSLDGARLGVLDLARATHALAHDLDGDEHTDVIVVAEGLHLVRGGVTPLEAQPLDAPHGIRRLALADVDRDGRVDLLGATREGIVLLQQRDPLVFSEAHTMRLPLLFRPHDLAVVDFGNRRALVVVGTGTRGFELWALPLTERVDAGAAEAPLLLDAPLHLTIPLR